MMPANNNHNNDERTNNHTDTQQQHRKKRSLDLNTLIQIHANCTHDELHLRRRRTVEIETSHIAIHKLVLVCLVCVSVSAAHYQHWLPWPVFGFDKRTPKHRTIIIMPRHRMPNEPNETNHDRKTHVDDVVHGHTTTTCEMPPFAHMRSLCERAKRVRARPRTSANASNTSRRPNEIR